MGIVGYAVDDAVELAAFALSGRAYVAELRAGTARALPVPGPVIDPRPSPDGRYVAYVSRGALRVVGAEGDGDRPVAEPEDAHVSYGVAEFVAAEEMSRYAVSGGRRTRTACWSPASTTAPYSGGGSPIPRIPGAGPPRWATRRRERPTPRCGSS